MASPWVATKVTPPRLRRGVVDRPRLLERLAGSTRCEADAGLGPCRIREDDGRHSVAGCIGRGRPRGRVGVPRRRRQSGRLVLDVRGARAPVGLAGDRSGRPAGPGVGAADLAGHHHDPAQRHRRAARRHRPRARRLPPRRRARGGSRDDLPARPSPAQPSCRHRHPRRSRPPAVAAAGARRAGRAAGTRPALHRRRGSRLPAHLGRPGARRGGRRHPHPADRGLGGGAAAGRAVDAWP